MPTEGRHRKCVNAVVVVSSPGPSKKQIKNHDRVEGTVKGEQRKELTGRYRQGNHDSLTKRDRRGPQGDRHDSGIRQAGRAGEKKK
jgi:hypothetical protein